MRAKRIAVTLGAICAVILLGVAQMEVAIPTAGWGLSFQAEGQTPVAPVDQAQLSRYDAAFVGDSSEKVLYLTFDAGYENGHMKQILAVLKKHDVPAAFFLVGDYLENNADLVRQMVEDGHIVGNHTAHHPDMSKLKDPAAFAAELTEVEEQFTQITGKELPKYYRPPQGLYSEENLKMAQELGYRTVFWSLAYADWDNQKQPSHQYAFGKLMPRTHNGAVVLLHATSQTNAEILDDLLTEWKQQGYRFASLDTLFSEKN